MLATVSLAPPQPTIDHLYRRPFNDGFHVTLLIRE
jgi:hypothetical protein